jgi:hypothetical protein
MKHRIAVAIVTTLALGAGTAPSWAAGSQTPPDARPAGFTQVPDVARPAGSSNGPDIVKPPIMGGPVRPPVNLPLPQGTGEQPPKR